MLQSRATYDVQAFFARRSLRIFPLYFLGLLAWYFVLPHFHLQPAPAGLQWPYWLYLQNVIPLFGLPVSGPGHFWSLAVEEHFYLLWPLCVWLHPGRYLPLLLLAIIIATPLLRWLMLARGLPVYEFSLTRMDTLAAGCLLAFAEARSLLKPALARRFFFLFLLLLTGSIVLWAGFSGSSLLQLQVWKYTLLSGCYAAMLGFLLCSAPGYTAIRLLSVPVARFCGRIGYGLYVWHPMVFMVVRHFLPAGLAVQASACFCLTFALSMVSYYGFELFFLRLKKHFPMKSAPAKGFRQIISNERK